MASLRESIENGIKSMRVDDGGNAFKGPINKLSFAAQICSAFEVKQEPPQASTPSGQEQERKAVPAVQDGSVKLVRLDYNALPASRSELDELFLHPDFDFELELERAKTHPELKDFLHQEFDPEYEFGLPENDPGQDLTDFLDWLVERGVAKRKAAENSDPPAEGPGDRVKLYICCQLQFQLLVCPQRVCKQCLFGPSRLPFVLGMKFQKLYFSIDVHVVAAFLQFQVRKPVRKRVCRMSWSLVSQATL